MPAAFLPHSPLLPTTRTTTTSTPTCQTPAPITRRVFLPLLPLLLLPLLPPRASALGPRPTPSPTPAATTFAAPPPETKAALLAAAATVPLAAFVAALDAADVQRVWFFGTFHDTCVYRDSKGLNLVGEGYPRELGRGSESPLHLMARIRNDNVTFTTDVLDGKFLNR